ncbi:MAG: hypothetical protein KY443_00005, partial [Actinobacteria bacterium]|nr:hypothetical protein [Actinomycetota bacterium]
DVAVGAGVVDVRAERVVDLASLIGDLHGGSGVVRLAVAAALAEERPGEPVMVVDGGQAVVIDGVGG